MTAAVPTSPAGTSQLEDEERCDVCGHPLPAHDAVGLRYCRATQANALKRNCICHVS